MRKTWIGTSWKMNLLLKDAEEYARSLRQAMEDWAPPCQIFIIPPFTALAAVARLLQGSEVMVGAQNMHWEDRGAFTGEISPLMIRDCGAQIVELGHSERRAYFAETDETVNRKVLAGLRHNLVPLVCVGETAAEKAMGVAAEVVSRQVKIALNGVSREQAGRVLLAYEPVWAIGDQGTPAEPEYAQQIHQVIREAAAQKFGSQAAEALPILYGGSVNPKNAVPFIRQPDIDGLFIGRSAWTAASFVNILRQVVEFI